MNAGAVQCPKCGSTQIHGGNKTEASGPGFGIGQVNEDGLVTSMEHNPIKSTFVNNCMACGYQWSPAAVTRANERAKKRKQEASQLESYRDWARQTTKSMKPLLEGHDSSRFMDWLERTYSGRSSAERRNAVKEKHPWVEYSGYRSKTNGDRIAIGWFFGWGLASFTAMLLTNTGLEIPLFVPRALFLGLVFVGVPAVFYHLIFNVKNVANVERNAKEQLERVLTPNKGRVKKHKQLEVEEFLVD